MDLFKYKIILGSASPRRQQLLKDMGLNYTTDAIHADESFPNTLKAEQIALYLAEKKAKSYAKSLTTNDLLITADTIVWIGDTVLNKPASELEATHMLRLLSAKTHTVYTGVSLTSANKQISFYDQTHVRFKELNNEEISFYIKNYKPFDKAGSYGAQDWLGLIGVTAIEGSYFNVMGLPTHLLYEHLKSF